MGRLGLAGRGSMMDKRLRLLLVISFQPCP